MNVQKIHELESARIYGIVGIILEFIGYPTDFGLHGLGFIISIAGLILLLLAIKSISNYYGDQKPFRYMLYSLISGIILSVVSALILFLVLVPLIASAANNSATSAGGFSPAITSLIGILFLTFLLILLTSLVSIIFQYMAYDNVGKLTGIHEFHTAALLLLIGILLVIVFIGVFLILIGIIFLIIAFAKLPDEAMRAEIDQNFNQNTNNEIF